MDKKQYHKQYNKERYHRLRNEYIQSLGGKCVVCGSVEELHFDHIDPSTKQIDVGRLLNHAQDVIKNELKKCQLLCYTHHLEKSMRNKELGGGQNRIDIEDALHGTSIMYHKFRCKCEVCKEYKRNSRK